MGYPGVIADSEDAAMSFYDLVTFHEVQEQQCLY